MRLKYFLPLLGHVVPTTVIGFAVVIPDSCIYGLNALTVGFGGSIVGTCISYWFGVRAAVNDRWSPTPFRTSRVPTWLKR